MIRRKGRVALILAALKSGPRTRVELARASRLLPRTVGEWLREFEIAKLVRRAGKEPSGHDNRATLWELNP
jgi:DNA-binding IclR family transcriptional regulator